MTAEQLLEAAEAYTRELDLERAAQAPNKIVGQTELIAVQGIALRCVLYHGIEAIVAAMRETRDG